MRRLPRGTLFMVRPPDQWPTPGWSESYFAKSRKGEAIASTPAEILGKIFTLFPAGQDYAKPGAEGGAVRGLGGGAEVPLSAPLAVTRAPCALSLCSIWLWMWSVVPQSG